jgi:ABC-type glycerol-3-phosphate transport system permease component
MALFPASNRPPWPAPWVGLLAVSFTRLYCTRFTLPLVIHAKSPRTSPRLQEGLAYLAQSEFGPDLPLLAAGATAAALPILIVFLLVRRRFFAGLRSGALRG